MSDYIQLAIALIAGIAAVFTGINIIVTNRNISIQKEQWAFSLSPTFKISYVAKARTYGVSFVIENSNNVYHEIEEVTFSTDEVEVTKVFGGIIDKGQVGEKKEIVAKGLIIILKPSSEKFYEGYLQIKGKDSLGKDFKVNSNAIKFEGRSVRNDLELSRTYLRKV